MAQTLVCVSPSKSQTEVCATSEPFDEGVPEMDVSLDPQHMGEHVTV
ncbi:MAG TPA: hypothetical protein VFX97_20425 [Pyrinomonadaceae bacterium]|nr:hypothetical protein [Pyrinomonadaceae bacterium]